MPEVQFRDGYIDAAVADPPPKGIPRLGTNGGTVSAGATACS